MSTKMRTLTLDNGESKKTFSVEDETIREEMKPLLLDADMLASYNTDPKYGDEALAAIIAGRQILVKTPNRDGGTTVHNYSPVYFYQIPNENNDHLYLFYLRDEKQNIDLSALGMGTIQLPVQADLKMVLSKTYTECPLK